MDTKIKAIQFIQTKKNLKLFVIGIFIFIIIFSAIMADYIRRRNFETDSNAQSQNSSVAANYWPMELGNYWIFEVSEFNDKQFDLWKKNFKGNNTGVNAISPNLPLNCNSSDTCTSSNVIGTKVAMVVNPTSGLNRFSTSRYVQWYKESPCAYHGPKYCNLIAGAPNSWNLQWYMRNPVEYSGQSWLGSEGGIRFNRAVKNGLLEQSGSSNLERASEVGRFGKFPKSTTFNSGAGRFPQKNTGFPGYSYLPLNKIINMPDTRSEVKTDFSYTFGMGSFINDTNQNTDPNNTFRLGRNSLINTVHQYDLGFDLEYVELKASDVLTRNKNLLSPNTDVLEVIFFEPVAGSKESACEAYYFAKNVGPIKMTHSIVADLPGDDARRDKTRQLCFSLFKDDFQKEAARKKTYLPNFAVLDSHKTAINNMEYTYPKNSFELITVNRKVNPTSDALGFHSPTAASVSDLAGPNSQMYIANGRYWIYDKNGVLYMEGSIEDAWKLRNPKGMINKETRQTIFPWTDKSPDAIEYEGDIPKVFGSKGIIVNNGFYWLHNPNTSLPFDANKTGSVIDLFPAYTSIFGNSTDNLGLSSTGFGQVLLTKDGKYAYYAQGSGNKLTLIRSGNISAQEKWKNAPKISGQSPLTPDTLMYGDFLDNKYITSNNQSFTASTIKSENQLLVFQKGAIWIKYGIEGDWEDWAGHLK